MDIDKARESLNEARAAEAASSRPPLPAWLSTVSAVAAGAGVALVGQSPDQGWSRALVLVAGLVLIAAAYLLPTSYRSRRGLHGFRGRVHSDNVVFLICAVALVVTGFNADSTLSTIYVGIGVAVAVAYYLLLRGRFGR